MKGLLQKKLDRVTGKKSRTATLVGRMVQSQNSTPGEARNPLFLKDLPVEAAGSSVQGKAKSTGGVPKASA